MPHAAYLGGGRPESASSWQPLIVAARRQDDCLISGYKIDVKARVLADSQKIGHEANFLLTP
jgi:hypothetical protein